MSAEAVVNFRGNEATQRGTKVNKAEIETAAVRMRERVTFRSRSAECSKPRFCLQGNETYYADGGDSPRNSRSRIVWQ